MKKTVKILAIPFAAILLISTLGFSVNRHYCMGMMVEESFYTPADPCSGLNDAKSCSNEWSSGEFTKDCCSDENLHINGVFVLSPSNEKTTVPDILPPAVSSLPDLFGANRVFPPSATTPFNKFPRPPSVQGRQILILVQRFLI